VDVSDRYPQRAATSSGQTKETRTHTRKINKEENAEISVLAFLSRNLSSKSSPSAVKEGTK
jgi:hypothetical protein